MSGTKTEIQEVERPDSEESVNFEDPCDEDESKKVFDDKNVTPATVPQPYVSFKSNQGMKDIVLRSILSSFKDASVKSQIDSQSKNESQDASTLSSLQKVHNNFEVRDEIMKEANSAEGSEEEETEHQRLVSQYLDLKENSEPHQLAKESKEEETEQQRIISNLKIMNLDPKLTCAMEGESNLNSSEHGHLRYLIPTSKLKNFDAPNSLYTLDFSTAT